VSAGARQLTSVGIGNVGWDRIPRSAGRSLTLSTPDGLREVVNDRVIVQIGGQPPSELLRTIGIELVEKRGEV
jgi:hypothetical protein